MSDRRSGSESSRGALDRRIRQELEAASALKRMLVEAGPDRLIEATRLWHAALRGGGKILFCGNGGSAADCQHAATELVVKLRTRRRALAAIALTTDTSILTAGSNDYGFDRVFARQVEALGRKGDLLVAISTSGKSANVLRAVRAARQLGVKTLALTGNSPNPLSRLSDLTLDVPSGDTQRIQEAHILYLHILCGQTERLMRPG